LIIMEIYGIKNKNNFNNITNKSYTLKIMG
jgi:hypothetical protein